jgi:hypothetical protein
MKIPVLWDITPWSPLKVKRLFRETYRLYLGKIKAIKNSAVAARVRARGKLFLGYVMAKAVLRQVFSQYSGFPCQTFIHPIGSQSSSSSIIQCWHNRTICGPVLVDLVPLQPKNNE